MTFTPLGIQAADIANLIAQDSATRPRTLQTAPGPSVIGTPCQRKLGHTILATPKTNTGDPLPSWIGTEAHNGMARILDPHPDWESEIPIRLDAYGIGGTCDAYHRPSRLVLDFKFTSPKAITAYKANGPGAQYRTQVHLYALGLQLAGYPVDTVAVAFIPRSGMTTGIHLWTEPYDETVCEAALRRYEAIHTVAEALGPAALDTADNHCTWCPWHDPQATDLSQTCPGHHEPPTGAGTAPEPNTRTGAQE